MEDTRRCVCNMCGAEFPESEIVIDFDEEWCPECGHVGCIMDIDE